MLSWALPGICRSLIYQQCTRPVDKYLHLGIESPANGFWLHCRRLEQGRFHWPKDAGDQQSLAVTARQLRWLIDGLNWQNAVAHQPFERRAVL
ncbi:MAG TPA: hypothetical protein DCW29_03430 [Janthinobacterium sp.]|nr:hypothetical protein [Janthinobacterium sp.]